MRWLRPRWLWRYRGWFDFNTPTYGVHYSYPNDEFAPADWKEGVEQWRRDVRTLESYPMMEAVG